MQAERKYGTVHRVGQVINLFSVERPEWGVNDVARALGMSKSGVSELLCALEMQGLLRRNRARRYRLGWRVVHLYHILRESCEFRAEARKAMERLVSLFGETVHLAALERGRVAYLEKLQGTRAVQVSVTAVGGKFPAHASGVGKVLLAHRPWAEVVEILEREGMPARTPNTITTVEKFREELERVRKRGYSHDLEEGVPELCCVAAPIRDHTGEVVAAMSLSVPAYRFEQSKDRYRSTLLTTTRKVSENLGFTGNRRPNRAMQKEVVSGSARR